MKTKKKEVEREHGEEEKERRGCIRTERREREGKILTILSKVFVAVKSLGPKLLSAFVGQNLQCVLSSSAFSCLFSSSSFFWSAPSKELEKKPS